MASVSSKSPKTKKKATKPKPSDVELQPDAWDRFERTVAKIAPPKGGKAAGKK